MNASYSITIISYYGLVNNDDLNVKDVINT